MTHIIADSIRQLERNIRSTCRSLSRTSESIRNAIPKGTGLDDLDDADRARLEREMRQSDQIVSYGLLTLSRLPDEPRQRLAILQQASEDILLLLEDRAP